VLFDTEMGQGIESCFKTVQEMEGEERPHCSCDATNVFQRWRFLNIVILTLLFFDFADIGIRLITKHFFAMFIYSCCYVEVYICVRIICHLSIFELNLFGWASIYKNRHTSSKNTSFHPPNPFFT